MLKFIAVVLSFIGFGLFYLSHANQALMAQTLARNWRYVGALCCVLGLLLLCWQLPNLVAILMWLAICTLIFSFFPLLSIFKKGRL